jgi:perosamine synthetase
MRNFKFNSLYYGSITLKESLVFFICILRSLYSSEKRIREKLHTLIKRNYFTTSVEVLSFGSARTALTTFLRSIGIEEGDEIIVSSFTCLAVPTGIIAANALPVYADINPSTLNCDLEDYVKVVTPKTKVIIVQHTLGKPSSIFEIIQFAKKNNILIIEDCALAIGTKIGDKFVGSFGDAAIVSMELSKTISSGWGGILVLNNKTYQDSLVTIYKELPIQSKYKSLKDCVQTIISSISYHPLVYNKIGKYIQFLAFRFKFYRRSTNPIEFAGNIPPDFVHKMGLFQILPAIYQWRRAQQVFDACLVNMNTFYSYFKSNKFQTVDLLSQGLTSVTPRVSIFVKDREKISNFFLDNKVELGQWFDGPLSPVPDNKIFNYSKYGYPNAQLCAESIVNFPCHSRINKNDIVRILTLLSNFQKLNPQIIIINKQF